MAILSLFSLIPKKFTIRSTALGAALILSACGGGGGDTSSAGESAGTERMATATAASLSLAAPSATVSSTTGITEEDARRFLAQASFGPNDATIQRVMALGYSAWIDEQLAPSMMPTLLNRYFLERRDRDYRLDTGTTARAPLTDIANGFYTRAIAENSQLKHRLVFAWSEIMVASLGDSYLGFEKNRIANYLDVLYAHCCGTYRDLLESVTRSPAMGTYLTFLRNQKEDLKTGRVPDENYAREILQLFSIGLYKLNMDGTVQKDPVTGKPIETYTPEDIKGLAKVFTGLGLYHGPQYTQSTVEWDCFWSNFRCKDPESSFHPMQFYPSFHSTSKKSFLGVEIAAKTTSTPDADLKIALDAIANHPNVPPFISKQLIQRLVTSNPSPTYVKDVAETFKASGGNLSATVKRILTHPEARDAAYKSVDTYGKVREPLLRMTALLRAFKHRSDTYKMSASPKDDPASPRANYYAIGWTANQGTSLNQQAFFSPSVFNFYRPAYVPPKSSSSARNMVAPELQIHTESATTAYVNWVRDALQYGIGEYKLYDADGKCGVVKVYNPAYPNCPVEPVLKPRHDVQFDFTEERTIAKDPASLVTLVSNRLLAGNISPALRATVENAVSSIRIDNLSSPSWLPEKLDQRVKAAIFLVMISPEFIIQK